MSSIVESNFEEAWSLLSDLIGVRDRISGYEIEFTESNERVRAVDAIHMVTFSDTILLFTEGDSSLELRSIVVLLTEIFHKAICRCVPIRAGLAHGIFNFNLARSMYAGPALIEAYRVGEASQWLGITLGSSIRARAVDQGMCSGKSNVVVGWEVPVKEGVVSTSVINWPAIFAHDLRITPPITVSQFYSAFESTFGAFEALPDGAKAKYSNTVLFMNAMLAAHTNA